MLAIYFVIWTSPYFNFMCTVMYMYLEVRNSMVRARNALAFNMLLFRMTQQVD